VPLFDRLDTSDSFVRPWRALFATATGKRIERRAMRGIEAVVGEILAERERAGARPGDYLQQMWDAWATRPPASARCRCARRDDHPHGRAVEPVRRARLDARELLLRPGALAQVAAATTRCSSAARTSRSAWRRTRSRCARCCADRGPRRRARLSLAAGHVPRDDALAEQHDAAPGLDRFDPDHYDGGAVATCRSPRASS
jgi:hypothetical protein